MQTISYLISAPNRHRQFLHLEAEFPCAGRTNVDLQLPAWRPGRYELGNFAKLIRAFEVVDGVGNAIPYRKKTKDCWSVDCSDHENIVVRYQFYANLLNAGSTWVDQEQVYINPVNCFLFDAAEHNTRFVLKFDLPENYILASGLTALSSHTLEARGVQQLMDCPIIASATLTHWTYSSHGVMFHIWIQGEYYGIKDRFILDHQRFTDAQISVFGDIPCDEYHFIYHFPHFAVRHGVEHENSTVIAMGPASRLEEEDWYRELIGIACHELYHTWNIKSIRPKEMMPYDFTAENYSRLGYVAEGVTTYFGDQFLHRCGVFDDEEYFSRLATAIERHLHNPGRFNLSVADSSYDTWLDGYQPGIPWKKVSIYNEGLLCAFICDTEIIKATNGTKNLDDVMTLMYDRFGKTKVGYGEIDYQRILEEVSGTNFTHIFQNLIHGVSDYMPYIIQALASLGLQMEEIQNKNPLSAHLGFATDQQGRVVLVMPESPADLAGLWFEDEIIEVNGAPYAAFDKNLVLASSLVHLKVNRHGKALEFSVLATDQPWLNHIRISKIDSNKGSFYTSWKRH